MSGTRRPVSEVGCREPFIHTQDGDNPTKLLPLTSQTKLTLILILTLILNPKSKLTLERGTNPTKP